MRLADFIDANRPAILAQWETTPTAYRRTARSAAARIRTAYETSDALSTLFGR